MYNICYFCHVLTCNTCEGCKHQCLNNLRIGPGRIPNYEFIFCDECRKKFFCYFETEMESKILIGKPRLIEIKER